MPEGYPGRFILAPTHPEGQIDSTFARGDGVEQTGGGVYQRHPSWTPTYFSMENSLRRLAMLEPAYSLTPDLPESGWVTGQPMILWVGWMHFTSG